jgi:DNA repair protein RadA/Sms
MAKVKSKFVCQQCGYESTGWLGKCPSCHNWNSFVETIQETQDKGRKVGLTTGVSQAIRLGEIDAKGYLRIPTTIPELDRALGGGLVNGQVVLLAGEPGIGKSTLLLQVAAALEKKLNVYYVSGEESVEQVALRAERLGLKKKETNIFLVSENDIDRVLGSLRGDKAGLVIIDSIQTMTTEDLSGAAGAVGQVRECTERIIKTVKPMKTPAFIVGHVTKEGAIAGPRVLEHLVDTVLWFEGSRNETLRIIRAVKNRFGPTDEAGVFEMQETGLVSVDNPSRLFLSEHKSPVTETPGSVVTCIMEGTRPLLIEVQALVVPSQVPIPRRVASGLDFSRLQVLVAVLSRRLGLPLGSQDIFVNVVGGIRVDQPAADLAITLAITSAFKNTPVGEKTVIFGEVGLLGEVRPTADLARRSKESKRLGYTKVISSDNARTLREAVKLALGNPE